VRDVRGELGEQRRADADENVRSQAGRLSRDLTLESNRAAEQRREQQLAENAQAKCIGDGGRRLREIRN
jgi:hypothetical protein